MDNQRIIYQNAEGGISVIIPTGEIPIEDVIAKDVPAGVEYSVVDASDLPSDRYFRKAWRATDGGVEIDIEAAKGVQRDKWREARAPKLAALDVEFIRAMEQEDTVQLSTIATKKQELRDVTATPLPDDIAGIKETWPEIL
jgi:hypothetical protein